jgi:large subunit ribosomal protein L9
MKVVLLEDVRALGRKGDVVEVSEGYARNFLLPKKKGVEANAGNLNTLKAQKARQEKLAAEQLAAAQELGAKIDTVSVELGVKTGEGGRLFGSVTGKEIAQALKEQAGLEVDKKKIVLPEPIKNAGDYIAEIRLHRDVTAKLKLKVREL